ncbi:uncharacterized protein LOC129321273 [Prosopis cineraria]|uniref:uncharacterized protein LOC129321273 n=1 Tax=Prosopis cineraria TaxID=364024 RepID=UPI00240F8480|nr:uncharacterized protein LOC129321273 [Prosopis cineraria]
MYVTRPLSMYINQPSALSLPPPEGPNSGILVLQDEEADLTCCFGLCKSNQVLDLPFPQNKDLTLRYSSGGSNKHGDHFYASFVPVLNLPLSSNRYYLMKTHGRHKGEALTNSSEEDMTSCCFCNIVSDVPPQPLDHNNTHQQFEVVRVEGLFNQWGQFTARSVAPDGVPPRFLESKGWRAYTSTRQNFNLGEAPGQNPSLRARLPGFDFPLSRKSSDAVVVGKWYCPFMFIREGRLKDQVRNSAYYAMTLEQNWEQIFECDSTYYAEGNNNSVAVDVSVQTMRLSVSGNEAQVEDVANGIMWFTSHGNGENEASRVGLSMAIVERMRWEQERAGYVWGNERHVRVKKVDELGGTDHGWNKYGCYVLVERFVLRRMDGSLVLSWEFKHIHHVRSKWD